MKTTIRLSPGTILISAFTLPGASRTKWSTRWRIAATATALQLVSLLALGQGSLTPPGAPGLTMKSLDQVEARTAISSAPFTISLPGSYYLTNNVSVSNGNAISINANGVTLDLNGFAISSTASNPNGSAVLINSGLSRIVIKNGFVQSGVTESGGNYSGTGFMNGITYTGTQPVVVRISDVGISGCLNDGIGLGGQHASVVESCTVQTVGRYGIDASVINGSAAGDCGSDAIRGDEASNSVGKSISGGTAINATSVQNCAASSVTGVAIGGSTAENSYGYSTSGTGVSVTTAHNCYGYSGGSGSGIFADTAQGCSAFSSNGPGINATTALNCYGSSTGFQAAVYIYGGIGGGLATNCYGMATGSSASGIYIGGNGSAQNCFAYSSGSTSIGIGIQSGGTAHNCYGYGTSYGIYLTGNGTVQGCYGYSLGSPGLGIYISGTGAADNCFGYGTGGSSVSRDGSGIYVFHGSVHNSSGYAGGAGFGVYGGETVENCYGQSVNGVGLHSGGIAANSVGASTNYNYGITTYIANSCYATGTANPPIAYNFHYNMPQ